MTIRSVQNRFIRLLPLLLGCVVVVLMSNLLGGISYAQIFRLPTNSQRFLDVS